MNFTTCNYRTHRESYWSPRSFVFREDAGRETPPSLCQLLLGLEPGVCFHLPWEPRALVLLCYTGSGPMRSSASPWSPCVLSLGIGAWGWQFPVPFLWPCPSNTPSFLLKLIRGADRDPMSLVLGIRLISHERGPCVHCCYSLLSNRTIESYEQVKKIETVWRYYIGPLQGKVWTIIYDSGMYDRLC